MTARTLALGLAGAVGIGTASHVLGSRPEATYGDGPLAPCPNVPNCALVRVPLAAPAGRVQPAALAAIQAHRSWRTGRAIAVTPTFDGVEATFALGLFRDQLTAAVEAGGDSSVLWIRSVSGTGRSDLGVNRARVHRIADAVRAALGDG